jgi:ribosomal-protein-alanine N-acetyltransferase
MVQSQDMDGATCLFRGMTEADIPQVYAIDHEAFPAESLFRPYSSYGRELRNPMAHYVIACIPSEHRMRQRRASLLKRLVVRRYSSHEEELCFDELIVGFAGFWTMLDEAHVIAIAVSNQYRRQGVGEGLLVSVIDMAAKLQSSLVTLEVRERNLGAQSLYSKYGFEVVGRRPRYYSDNQEDAILMTLDNLQSSEFRRRFADVKSNLLARHCLAHTVDIPHVAAELDG